MCFVGYLRRGRKNDTIGSDGVVEFREVDAEGGEEW